MKEQGIRKVVILARGLGKRMREQETSSGLNREQAAAANTGVKAMIPIDRPFLDYVLGAFADAGYTEACLVIGPEHDAVRNYYAGLSPRRIRIGFAIQQEPRGTADALLSAESATGGEEFVVCNSDNYYPAGMLATLRTLGEPGAVLFEHDALVRNSNIPDERIRAFAYGVVGSDGYLKELVEKPGPAQAAAMRSHALVSMNAWRFSSAIFDVCRHVPLSPRGEYELPMAVGEAVRSGMKLKIVSSQQGVLDLSRRTDIPEVAERLKHVTVSL